MTSDELNEGAVTLSPRDGKWLIASMASICVALVLTMFSATRKILPISTF